MFHNRRLNAGRPVEDGASTGEKRRIDAVVKPGVSAGDDGRAGIAGIFNVWRGEGDVVVALRVVQKRKRDFAVAIARDAGPVEGVKFEDLRANITASIGHQKQCRSGGSEYEEKGHNGRSACNAGREFWHGKTYPLRCATDARRRTR